MQSQNQNQNQNQHYLITTTTTTTSSSKEKEIDFRAASWKLPYSIDDSDLTFDGKPLNLLYEENKNRWRAEHSGSSGSRDEKRGRTKRRT